MFVIDTNIFNFIIIKLGLYHCTASKPKLKMENGLHYICVSLWYNLKVGLILYNPNVNISLYSFCISSGINELTTFQHDKHIGYEAILIDNNILILYILSVDKDGNTNTDGLNFAFTIYYFSIIIEFLNI